MSALCYRCTLALVAALAITMILGCGGANSLIPAAGESSIAFRVNWPTRGTVSRTIPENTVQIDVTAMQSGKPVGKTTIVYPDSTGTLFGIPAGLTTLIAQAKDDGSVVVAEGCTDVTAVIGQSVAATLTMTALPTIEEYTLTADPPGGGVDDDIVIYRNGIAIFTDNDGLANALPEVRFQAKEGDAIHIVAIDAVTWWEGLTAITITRVSDGASYRLTDGIPARLSTVPAGSAFFDQSFVIDFP
jgi:hypothetical protein